jgi:glycosyltransferase involved in cell wall biosynthesis
MLHDAPPRLSLVVPVKDEAENLPALVSQIREALRDDVGGWELICIDDGSTDDSVAVLRRLRAETGINLRVIVFDRNYGKTAALAAGFERAAGEIVVIMDADCQNDPADLPAFLDAIADKDIVCGFRARRLDSRFRLWQSRLANRIRNRFTRDGVRDSGCGYQAIRRDLLRKVKLYEGMHRFLPCMVQMEGGRFGQIEVRHHPRIRGQSKYPFWSRLRRAAVDLWAVRWMIDRRIAFTIDEIL